MERLCAASRRLKNKGIALIDDWIESEDKFREAIASRRTISMRMIMKAKFDNRNHDAMVNEYCSRFRARVAVTPESFDRLYSESNEVVMAGENETAESVLQYLYERSEAQETAPAKTAPLRIQDVVVVPVLISYIDGEPLRMWSDVPSAEPPH